MSIYLDYAAATPWDKKSWLKSFRYNFYDFGNPLSVHDFGLKSKTAIEKSRNDVAKIINANNSEIFFCASGTESVNLALLGAASANWGRGKHIITSMIEHHAVLNTMEQLESRGFEVTYLPVDKKGLVSPETVKKYLRPDTILVSIMLTNNETGIIQPIKEIIKLVKEFNNNCLVHSDACQAGNWLDIDVQDINVDLLSLDSSKVYGPKGVGALYIKTGTAIYPIIHGGTQENNLRAGTHNVAGIIGFSESLKISYGRRKKDVERLTAIKNWLIDRLSELEVVQINSNKDDSTPHIINFSIIGRPAQETVNWFNEKGVCISAGAACTTGSLRPSHVILAQTGSIDLATSAVRVSLGRKTRLNDLKKFIQLLDVYLG